MTERTTFYCHVVEAIASYEGFSNVWDDQESGTRIIQLENGDILIRHSGDRNSLPMVNWPYDNGTNDIVIGYPPKPTNPAPAQ
jgi:hypothetical protein